MLRLRLVMVEGRLVVCLMVVMIVTADCMQCYGGRYAAYIHHGCSLSCMAERRGIAVSSVQKAELRTRD